jgi:hypothetical protein
MDSSAGENRISMSFSGGGFPLRFIFRWAVAVFLVAIVWWSKQDEYIYRWDRTFLGALIGCAFWLIVSFSRGHYKKAAVATGLAVVSGILLLLWRPIYARVPASVPPSTRNLSQLVHAVLNYEQAHGHLPPAYTVDASGEPLQSWRTLILPYIEQNPLYDRIRLDEPWDSSHNRAINDAHIELFHCPGDNDAKDDETSYVAVTGSKTAWGVGKGLGTNQIKDGVDQTILLVEMKHSGIKWAEPRDLDMDNLPPGINKQTLLNSLAIYPGGIFVAFAGGGVMRVLSTTKPEDFEALTTRDGKEVMDSRGLW